MLSMATKTQLLAAYDSQLRLCIPADPPAGQLFESDGRVLRITGQHRGFVETAHDLGVEGEALDLLIAEHRDHFADRGEAVEWKTRSHDAPADLTSRLTLAGFVPEEPETVMVGDAEAMARDEPLPEGVAIRAVHERSDFERISRLESEVWGDDFGWLADDLHGRITADPESLSVLVAEADGLVVSAAWLVFKNGTDFAGLWGGSTLEEWRGRGIYRALVARRAQLARHSGVRYLQVDASADSEPILRRLGFTALTTTTPYVWNPS
jgi:GNAT superfamily N-acetyltransferase